MPANLPPDYKDAEELFRAATTHEEKLAALRDMIALLPKHKGTEKLLADLRKRMAKLEDEEAQAVRSGARRADPGHVKREGAGQWVLLGPPNAGKSALLAALTHAHPEVAAYPFTTRAPQTGMMAYEDVQVQLVDTPAVAADRTEPYLANLARNADGVLWVVDVEEDDLPEAVAALRELMDKAHVWPASRPLPADASALWVRRPLQVVLNKSDLDDEEGTFAGVARELIGSDLPAVRVSATTGAGLDTLRALLFNELHRIRIYTKEPGHKADPGKPFVLPEGATVEDLAAQVHQDLKARLHHARLWGAHARFEGQQVDKHHVLCDRDVVELHA